MYVRRSNSVREVLAFAVLAFSNLSLTAQAAPSAKTLPTIETPAALLNFVTGYSFLKPDGTAGVVMACLSTPTSIYPGDPVTINASTKNLDPSLNAIYSWTGSGATGSGTTITVNTDTLAPGVETVQGTVKEGKPGREGLKRWQIATCATGFIVKPFEPPSISCSAAPAALMPGETSTITTVAMSPQHRPLSVSYSATAGAITGHGETAVFSSTGASTGAVEITCDVADDKDHLASARTSVTILPPPPPPPPHVHAMCSLSFETDTLRPTGVDNEAKACLDQVALELKQQTDAKAVLVGESTREERALTVHQQALAAKRRHVTVEQYAMQRAVNAKDYLVSGQGIDPSRISVATGPSDGEIVQNYLVPAGANFASDIPGTIAVDEATVKPEIRKPLPPRHPAPAEK